MTMLSFQTVLCIIRNVKLHSENTTLQIFILQISLQIGSR